MIDDPDDPHMVEAQGWLFERINALVLRHRGELDNAFMLALRQLSYDHRARCKDRGLDFPVLVPLVLPRFGKVSLVRADLELPGIRAAIVKLVADNPGVTIGEVAQAIRSAFPGVRSLDLAEEVVITERGRRVLQ